MRFPWFMMQDCDLQLCIATPASSLHLSFSSARSLPSLSVHATMHGCARAVSAVAAAVAVAAATAGGVPVVSAAGDTSTGQSRRQDCSHPTTVSGARDTVRRFFYSRKTPDGVSPGMGPAERLRDYRRRVQL